MYPDSHLKSLKYSRLKKKFYRSIGILIIFSSALLLIGPLIHEGIHIAWMKYESCLYNINLSLGLKGLYGAVKPVCHLSDTSLVVFYSTGFLSTLGVGAVLNVLAVRIQSKTSHYIYLLSAGTGLMLSVVIGVMAKGDFAEFFRILGFEAIYSQVFTVTLILLIIVSNFKSVDLILSELEGEE